MKPMKTVLKLLPETFRNELYGIEIEVEGTSLPTPGYLSPNIWRVEKDDSLKTEEAWEYVTPTPLSLEGVKNSLDYLALAYTANKSEVFDSIRAGVHVHMNVQDWNVKQLFTFATAYYLVEDLLIGWCGPGREGNLFCLRARDAEFVLFRILKSLKEKNLKHLKDDIIRYSSLNYCSLFKYGSLEFRGMRGTGELDLIYKWVEIINDLREASLQFDSPATVVAMMSGDGELEFLKRILPNTHHLFIENPDAAKLIREASRRVQMLAFGVNWEDIGKQSVNIFKQESW
jgi:hypothetical protein